MEKLPQGGPGVTADWVQFDGWLSTVDIANDQTIVGANGYHDVFLRNGIDGQWSQLPGKLK